jgi:hypothetical protein
LLTLHVYPKSAGQSFRKKRRTLRILFPNQNKQLDSKRRQLVSRLKSADAKPNVADGFGSKALLYFSEDFRLGDSFELVMQCGLEHADVEYAFTQRDRRWVHRDAVADHFDQASITSVSHRHSRKPRCTFLIDFEGTCHTSEIGVMPWGLHALVAPYLSKKFAIRRQGTLEDDYALGVILFQLSKLRIPSNALAPPRRRLRADSLSQLIAR